MDKKEINFRDTEVAFAHKNNRDLRVQYLLFKGMGSNRMVQMGKWASELAGRLGIPVGWAVKPTLYRHFVTGESLRSSIPAIAKLYALGVQGVMDYSAEGGSSEEVIEENFAQNLQAVSFASEREEISHAVFKVSGMGEVAVLEKANDPNARLNAREEKELARVKGRFMQLCRTAYEQGVRILVDAEHYAYQDLIDRMTEEAILMFNKEKAIVFATLQMYRKDRLEYLRHLDELGAENGCKIGIKFVRGAYMEEERELAVGKGYPDPICATKEDTDKNFNTGVVYVMDRLDRFELFMGTHNELSTMLLVDLLHEKGLENNDHRVYFSQLYGMSDNLTFNLAKEGYNVTKYCPYAPVEKVLPYLIRRALENTSVKGQSSRELILITRELERRGKRKKM